MILVLGLLSYRRTAGTVAGEEELAGIAKCLSVGKAPGSEGVPNLALKDRKEKVSK